MPTGLLLWIVAMILTVTGLVLVVRYRVAVGGFLILSGLALGLLSSEYIA